MTSWCGWLHGAAPLCEHVVVFGNWRWAWGVDGASEVTMTGVGPMSLCRILLRLVTFFVYLPTLWRLDVGGCTVWHLMCRLCFFLQFTVSMIRGSGDGPSYMEGAHPKCWPSPYISTTEKKGKQIHAQIRLAPPLAYWARFAIVGRGI
jgi:hypothetical protein